MTWSVENGAEEVVVSGVSYEEAVEFAAASEVAVRVFETPRDMDFEDAWFDFSEAVDAPRMREVFDFVKPVPNWKDPIDARVSVEAVTAAEIRRAVVWFAGGVPSVVREGDVFHVTGAGYYEWVGA